MESARTEGAFVSQNYGELWTICGPIFGKHIQTLKYGVEVPSGYYKILVRKEGGEVKLLSVAFDYFPATGDAQAYLRRNLKAVREIEQLAGFDFFNASPKAAQYAIETSRPATLW